MNKTFEMTMIELIALGVLIFLFSIWFARIFNSGKLRRQQAKNADYIEKLNTEHAQQQQALENDLKFERQSAQLGHAHLIEKRVAVLDQGYKYLVDFDGAIHAAVRPVPGAENTASQQEAYDLAVLRFTSFVTFFERNKLYFSRGVAKKVSKSHASIATTLDLMRALLYANQTLSNGINEELQSLFNKADSEIRRARLDIESELRVILRVEETSQNIDADNDIAGLSVFR
ncbi:hypothetical protein [Psychromonas sp.]|uniref:hypothetical protein n=1 Tax=Psychromonas sp. TaxID=1884585 RepID=UPI0035669CBC